MDTDWLEDPLEIVKRPLAGHRLAESGDRDLVRSTVGSAFCEHRLSPLSREVALDAHFHGLRLDSAGLYYLDYGTEVQVDPTDLTDFYLVQVPLAGRASITVDSETFVSAPDLASVLQPGRRASVTVEFPNQHLLLRVDQTSLEQVLRRKLGREPATPVVFDPQMDLTTPSGRTFRDLLTLLVGAVDTATSPSSIALREFERLLISQLILGQPNNYRDELDSHPRPTVARPVARAAELIEAHAHEPLTVDDIAVAVGVGTRGLQQGFRRYYDTTPTAFLRDVRLRRVRTELMQADPAETTVTDIAARWGFLHPGRFSVVYRRRFGETPSQTLRMASDTTAQNAGHRHQKNAKASARP